MTSEQNVAETLKRIITVDNDMSNDDEKIIPLAREHIRRVALWTDKLEHLNKLNDDLDDWLVDIPVLIDPSTELDVNTKEILTTYASTMKVGPIMIKLFRRTLQWARLIELEHLPSYDLPNPYSPVVRLHELGGCICPGDTMIYTHWSGTGFQPKELRWYLDKKPYVDNLPD